MRVLPMLPSLSAGLLAGIALSAAGAATLMPAAAQTALGRIEAIVTCSSTAACAGWDNTSTGPALQATGTKGYGLVAVSTSSNAVKATSTSASAVSGISNGGGLGALRGENDSGSGYGVYGLTKNGSGGVAVYGSGGSGIGVQATSTGRTALVASATTGDGIDASTTGSSGGGASGLFSRDTSSNSLNFGAQAWSNHGTALYARDISGTTALRVDSGTTDSGNPVVSINAGNGKNVAYIDDFGNIFITGEILTGGSCSNGCVAYSARTAQPTTEDTGDAILQSGRAYVGLSPAMALTMQRTMNYRVFVTPMGETNGLYVAAKTKSGFTVVESHGGRSNVAFSYRIVAQTKPPAALRAH